jgi:hypothetical protein
MLNSSVLVLHAAEDNSTFVPAVDEHVRRTEDSITKASSLEHILLEHRLGVLSVMHCIVLEALGEKCIRKSVASYICRSGDTHPRRIYVFSGACRHRPTVQFFSVSSSNNHFNPAERRL